ncbi:uncharacterized protein [Eucyclogobius newberryi]|uniref:uncharacterized protein n=1 Tax=Eucyclogobius newberryi TaxID=166745 RepID=UPI003B5A5EB5
MDPSAIASELNRGCYSSTLLDYFCEKSAYPDDYLSSESEDDLTDDERDFIQLENIPSLRLTLDEEEDGFWTEEGAPGHAEELQREITDAIATVTFAGENEELEKIRNFDCKCYSRRKENSLLSSKSCSGKLTPELMYKLRSDSLAAEREWQDMRIIGHMEANRRSVITSELTTSTKKPQKKRKFARTSFFIGGTEVCRSTFLFLMAIGKDTLTDIIKHYDENGATPRLRKKRAQPQPRSRRFISYEVIHTVVEFIKNYAEVHSIMLPGRHPGHKDWHVKLLPTHVTKASVWRLYVKSAKELGEPAVCKSSFRSLWKQLRPCHQVVENSSPESHLNIPQLVGTADGRVFVKNFDWQKHLSPFFRRLPKIKSYQHFSFDAKRPGVVLAKSHCGAEPVEYQLLRTTAVLPPVDNLHVLVPPGLNIDRQTYLHEKIRPFCADEAKDITCPAPRVTAQKTNVQKRLRT